MSHLVFVFGTLKEGFPNFSVNAGVRVPGSFRTVDAYPMFLVGERHSPWLMDRRGEGLRVRGQVFRVDDATLAAMDRLERVAEPDGYRRALLEVEGGEPETVTLPVYAYLKPGGQLADADVRKGPLPEYTAADAALYRPRN